MSIASITSWTEEHVCFVEVRSEDGARGFGQCAPYHPQVTCELLHRLIAPLALGRPEEPIGTMIESIFASEYKFAGSFLCRAMAGLDTALWDLAARRRGVPVCTLAGGSPRVVPVYASSMRRDLAPQEELERFRLLRDSQGFRAFKCKVGARRGTDRPEAPGRSRALVEGLRRTLGGDAILIADANGAYGPDEAIAMAGTLRDLGYAAFEEPCLHDEPEQTAAVHAVGLLPIAGGEQDWALPVWRRAVRDLDICQPDIGYVGGFHRALTIAGLAAAAGRTVTPHTANRSMLQVFSLHLMSCLGQAWSHLECSIEAPPWVDGLLLGLPPVIDGCMACPTGPGWGVEPDPQRLARMTRRISKYEPS